MVLDAQRLGDWEFLFHREVWLSFGPSEPPSFLPQQRRNLGALIEVFGPNQLVLVANPGNPIPPAGTDFCSPQTLHGCLELTYVCRRLTIHGFPESSHARLEEFNKSGALILMSAKWTQATASNNSLQFRDFHPAHINTPDWRAAV